MSPTHDYVIANGTGSSVRSDINDAFAAVVSQNSSSTAPATTYAYMIWVDTTTNIVKMRNGANSAWIELFETDGEFGSKTFNGNITLNAQGDLRFADSDSSNWVAFQAPATVASNVTWTLPSADGTANQTLVTNGSGTLSWATPTSTSDKITEGNTEAEVVDTGSDGHFKVTTEGTERLRVDSSGRCGIGTSSPHTRLHVDATKNTTAAKITTSGALFNSDYTQLGFGAAADSSSDSTAIRSVFTNALTNLQSDLAFLTHTGSSLTEKIRITSGGSVGIGITNPSETLHVAGDMRVGTGIGSGNTIHFSRSGQTDAARIACDANSNLAFHTNAGERARIDSSGRLLVGTSTARTNFSNSTDDPQLQIESANGFGWASIRNSNSSGGTYVYIAKSRGTGNVIVQNNDVIGGTNFEGNDGSKFVTAATITAQIDGTPGTGDMPGRLVFSVTADGASSPTERMRITNQGYLYSGVTSAEGINSAQAVTGERIVNINSDTLSDQAASHMARQGNSANDGTAQSCYLAYYRDAVATAPGAFFKGYRGSGGTNGTIRIKINSDGNITNSNNSYGSLSDAKLKENIVDASSQWDDIKNLRVRNYNFKEETGQQTHRQIGLIAQEAEQISPGLVIDFPDANNETTKSINYSVLYMKAVKALQEAMDRIEQLEAEMAEVKAQLS